MAAKKKAISRSKSEPHARVTKTSAARPKKKITTKSIAKRPASVHAIERIFTGKAKTALERVRKICLSLDDVEEKISHGSPGFFRRGKQFVHFFDNHHGDDRIAIWCRAPDGAQAMLLEADAEKFFIPPYVGPSGWIGMRLDLSVVDYDEVRAVLHDAWSCAFSSRKTR